MIAFRHNWPRSIIFEIEDRDFYRDPKTRGGALMPTKNRAHGQRKGGGKFTTARQAHFRRLIKLNCAGLEVGLGPYRLQVEQVCRQVRKVGAMDFPQPDSDATLAAIRDALEARPGWRGLIANDAQIVANEISSTISTASPRECGLRIELTAAPHWGG